MKNTNKALGLAKYALAELLQELEKPGLAERGPASRQQLARMRPYLEVMVRILEGEEALRNGDRWGYGMGRAIADSWPHDHPLGLAILEAEQEFKEAVKWLAEQGE